MKKNELYSIYISQSYQFLKRQEYLIFYRYLYKKIHIDKDLVHKQELPKTITFCNNWNNRTTINKRITIFCCTK